MTDARFPERWLNDRRVLRLPDDAFRLFVCGLAWSVANKTDGWLSDEDLQLIPGVNIEAAVVLQDAELWWSHGHHWQITEFEETQTTREQLEAAAQARRKARDKKRRQRAALSVVPRDVPGDNTRPGQARPGQAPRNVVPGNERADEVDSFAGSAQLAATTQGGSGRDGESLPATGVNGSGLATPSQTRKRVHDGPNHSRTDAQHDSIEVHAGAQPQTVTRARP